MLHKCKLMNAQIVVLSMLPIINWSQISVRKSERRSFPNSGGGQGRGRGRPERKANPPMRGVLLYHCTTNPLIKKRNIAATNVEKRSA